MVQERNSVAILILNTRAGPLDVTPVLLVLIFRIDSFCSGTAVESNGACS